MPKIPSLPVNPTLSPKSIVTTWLPILSLFLKADSSETLGLVVARMSTATASSHAQFPALQSSQRLVVPFAAQAMPLQECVPWWLHVFQYSLLSSDIKLAGLRDRQSRLDRRAGSAGNAYTVCDRE